MFVHCEKWFRVKEIKHHVVLSLFSALVFCLQEWLQPRPTGTSSTRRWCWSRGCWTKKGTRTATWTTRSPRQAGASWRSAPGTARAQNLMRSRCSWPATWKASSPPSESQHVSFNVKIPASGWWWQACYSVKIRETSDVGFSQPIHFQADDGSLRQHVAATHPQPRDPRPGPELHGVSICSCPVKREKTQHQQSSGWSCLHLGTSSTWYFNTVTFVVLFYSSLSVSHHQHQLSDPIFTFVESRIFVCTSHSSVSPTGSDTVVVGWPARLCLTWLHYFYFNVAFGWLTFHCRF